MNIDCCLRGGAGEGRDSPSSADKSVFWRGTTRLAAFGLYGYSLGKRRSAEGNGALDQLDGSSRPHAQQVMEKRGWEKDSLCLKIFDPRDTTRV